jgi:hypothetical protein
VAVYQEGNVLLVMSFILSWNFIIMDEDWLQKYEGLSVRLQKASEGNWLAHMATYKTWKTYGSGPRVDSLSLQARRDEIQRHNEEVRQNREILKNRNCIFV